MNNLKQILNEKGLKQSWLAKKMGVSSQTMTNWVSGYSHPSIEKLKLLTKILGASVEEIFFDRNTEANISLSNDNKNKIKESEKVK